MRITLARLTFTTAVRVIDRVHHDTANRRTNTAPTIRTGLAVAAQVVLVVADFADRGAAIDVHLAHFGRTQTHRRVQTFTSSELSRRTGAASELRALTRLHLDVVNRRTDRNVTQLHRIAGLDRRFRTDITVSPGFTPFGAMM